MDIEYGNRKIIGKWKENSLAKASLMDLSFETFWILDTWLNLGKRVSNGINNFVYIWFEICTKLCAQKFYSLIYMHSNSYSDPGIGKSSQSQEYIALMMINKCEVWSNPWSVSCDKRVMFWLPASESAAAQAGQAQSVRTCRIFYNYNQSGSGRSSQINVK